MTVSTTLNKITYSCNGATTVFTFPFPGVDADDITVQLVDSSGVTTTLAQGASTTQYQVALAAPIPPNPTGVGGTVTYNPSGTPVPTGNTLTIFRELPVTQETSFDDQGTLYPTVIEQALDYLTMLVQQIPGLRSIVAPDTDPVGLNYTLPAVASRAGQALIFDASGNVTTGAVPSGGVISAPMVPVVSAASLALARTALGLGAISTEGIGGGLVDDGSGNVRVNFPVTAIAISHSLVAADFLKYYNATGPINFTLARANTYFSGYGFWVWTAASTVTFVIDSHDVITNYGLASGASLTIPAGCLAWVATDAAATGTWFVQRLVMPKSTNSGLLTGAGTLTIPAGCTRIKGRMVGGGAGGSSAVANGITGNASNFGTGLFICGGGTPGLAATTGAGGSGGAVSGTGTPVFSVSGGDGGALNVALGNGGQGGCSFLGGNGAGGLSSGGGSATVGTAAAANSGSGGGGAGTNTGGRGGPGSGAGAYLEFTIDNPAATYAYSIAAAASGATSSGTGAAGGLWVEFFYD